jgi:hypothetical protein
MVIRVPFPRSRTYRRILVPETNDTCLGTMRNAER